jgi:hypothetical protein
VFSAFNPSVGIAKKQATTSKNRETAAKKPLAA